MMQVVKEFVAHPVRTGMVVPSSLSLAKVMCDQVDFSNAKCIVELGAGTGAFTKYISSAIPADSVFFSLEINPAFSQEIRRKLPHVTVYTDCATMVRKYLAQHGMTHGDAIISGLPFGIFSEELQQKLLGAIHDALAPGGVFVTFAYLHGFFVPMGLRFKKMMSSHFSKVEISPVVWRNFPPAVVYRAVK